MIENRLKMKENYEALPSDRYYSWVSAKYVPSIRGSIAEERHLAVKADDGMGAHFLLGTSLSFLTGLLTTDSAQLT